MNFEWNHSTPLEGELLYRQDEYSIDFKATSTRLLAERVGRDSSTSLLFTTLQIEIGIENGDMLYPWGLFPNTRWKAGRLSVPIFQPGRVRCISEGDQLRPGVSVPFPGSSSWPIVWDKSSGWICIGSATPGCDAAMVEYAQNAAVVLASGKLVSLWLKPEIKE